MQILGLNRIEILVLILELTVISETEVLKQMRHKIPLMLVTRLFYNLENKNST